MNDEERIIMHIKTPTNIVDEQIKAYIEKGYFLAGMENYNNEPDQIVYILRRLGKSG